MTLPTVCEVNYDYINLDFVVEDYTPFRSSLPPYTPAFPDGLSSVEYFVAENTLILPRTVSLASQTVRSTGGSQLPGPPRCQTQFSHYTHHYSTKTESIVLLSKSEPVNAYLDSGLHSERRRVRARTALPYINTAERLERLRDERERNRLPPRWVPAMNAWIEQSKNPVPYLSFVHNVNLTDRGTEYRDEAGDAARRRVMLADLQRAPCTRYMDSLHAKHRKYASDFYQPQLQNKRLRKNRLRRNKGDDGLNSKNSCGNNDATNANSKFNLQRSAMTPRTTIEATLPSVSTSLESDDERTSGQKAVSNGYDYIGNGHCRSTENRVDELAGSVRDMKVMSDYHDPRVQSPPEDPSPHQAHRLSTVDLDDALNLLVKQEEGPTLLRPENHGSASINPASPSSPILEETIIEQPEPPKTPLPPRSPQRTPQWPFVEPPKPELVEDRRPSSKKSRGPVQKKTRVARRVQLPDGLEDETKIPPQFNRRNRDDDWLNEDFSSEALRKDEPLDEPRLELPPLPDVKPLTPPTSTTPLVRPPPPPSSSKSADDKKKRWGEKRKDTSLEDELRRQRLAEERRAKAAKMYERLRGKKYTGPEDDDGPRFEDYGFLSKYCNFLAQFCIFNQKTLDMYRKAFDAVKEEGNSFIGFEQVLMGLRGVNRGLQDSEEEYLYRILELTGYKVTDGADFQLFAVMCALSQRIASLDEWMKNLIGRMDFKMLDMKMFMCRTLWECNVDPETNTIPLDQLCVELRAGGVSYEHECEVREKLGHLSALDLLDFLTYIPLFLMIHSSVVHNPLDDSRTK